MITSFDSYTKLSKTVADIVEMQLSRKADSKFVLPTGSTPMGLYSELASRELDWSNAMTFNLDIYIMNPNHPQSYQTYMKENFFNKISIYPNNCLFPSKPTLAYEDIINHFGGIDLCILGIGSNGHIAFNEPGSSFKSRTRVVELSEQTIQDNARFFDSIEDVPTKAITMGLGTIMEAEKIILMANGVKKKSILNQAIYGTVTEEIPASILQKHKHAEIYYCD